MGREGGGKNLGWEEQEKKNKNSLSALLLLGAKLIRMKTLVSVRETSCTCFLREKVAILSEQSITGPLSVSWTLGPYTVEKHSNRIKGRTQVLEKIVS